MKKRVLSIFLFTACALSFNVNAQNLTQADYIGVTVPKVIGSGGSSRLPIVWRATVQNLTPNKEYRYFVQVGRYTDLGTTNTGAGNTMLMHPDSANYTYTTGPSIKTANAYSVFKTNASGSYTGWFGAVYTSNARFTKGNYVIPTIAIAEDTALLFKRALNDSILVVTFGAGATDTSGTGIWGKSTGTRKNILLFFDNETGSGRPLTTAYIEDEGVAVASVAKFYTDSVNGFSGRWGTIIPNLNPNGVKRIEQRSLADGSLVNFSTSQNGVWNGVSTVNPSGGLNALAIETLSPEIPVELTSFSAAHHNSEVVLNWKTATETNNYGFDIERRTNNGEFSKIGFVKGSGSTASVSSYTFTDKSAASGNYAYRLKQIDLDGSVNYSKEVSVNTATVKNFNLAQNYPNPFNPSTVINYTIPSAGHVTLKVYNVIGNQIATLVNQKQEAGTYNVMFTMNSDKLASGVYFYKLEAGSYSATKKMILVR